MAKVNTKEMEAARQESIQETVSKTEQFYSAHKNVIWGAVIAVLVVGFAVLAYSKYVYQPKCREAMEQTYPAERNFQNGEYELALNGDGNVLGFAEIIDTYGAKAGKAVYLYAGVCALQLGEYENAIDYLSAYNGKDQILAARALACKGDALVGIEDYTGAVKAYTAAADKADNIFAAAYLVKAGVVYEQLGKKAEALKCYETVKDQYPQSVEGYDIDKYISRVSK